MCEQCDVLVGVAKRLESALAGGRAVQSRPVTEAMLRCHSRVMWFLNEASALAHYPELEMAPSALLQRMEDHLVEAASILNAARAAQRPVLPAPSAP